MHSGHMPRVDNNPSWELQDTVILFLLPVLILCLIPYLIWKIVYNIYESFKYDSGNSYGANR